MAHDGDTVAPELQAMLDASPDAVVIVDRAGTIVALNRRAESLFATTADRLMGSSVERLIPERLRAAHAAARAAYASAPSVRAMSTRRGLMGLRADGTEFPVEISLTPVAGSSGGLVMAVVHEPAGASDAVDAIPDAILTTDAGGRVEFLNRAAEELTGWARGDARGRPLVEILPLVSEAGGTPLESPVAECLAHGAAGTSCEAVLPARPGWSSRALDLSATPIRDASGAVTGAAVVARDVTHARLIARQLAHQATHDPLTGLVNRSEFERRLARVLASAAETRAEHALCFLDLDGFKRVNDACGHRAGDELLRQLSEVMRSRMRSRDTLARLGGDEFGMLLEHCRPARAARIADGVRTAIGNHRFTFGAESYAVAASIGIVPIRRGSRRAADLIQAADSACYLAKRSGGNRVLLADARQRAEGAGRNHEWSRGIVLAISENRFRLFAQPVVPLDHGDARAPRYELLLRLDAGHDELLPPRAFLPAARRHGLMPAVDRWVIREAVRRLSAERRADPARDPTPVALNLDDETVAEGTVLTLVREELAGSGVPPYAFCFEIAESALAAHATAGTDLLRGLRAAGCQTTLEHCGSGMAAFTLLRRLRPDYLKIAAHIVRGLGRDPVHRVLAGALNDVGHVLGLRTIGVQVEDADALVHLRRIGVDYAQGFALGRPAPVSG